MHNCISFSYIVPLLSFIESLAFEDLRYQNFQLSSQMSLIICIISDSIYFKGRRVTFIDKVRIYVKGGSGGMGCPSAGGCGGKGGDVVARCIDGSSLAQFKTLGNRRHVAGHGSHYK